MAYGIPWLFVSVIVKDVCTIINFILTTTPTFNITASYEGYYNRLPNIISIKQFFFSQQKQPENL